MNTFKLPKLFVERVQAYQNDRHPDKVPTISELNHRLVICDNCENCQGPTCQKLGCSIYRFRETLLAKNPLCPEGKHALSSS